MLWTLAKLTISASVISFTSWLAGARPALAGFILALPISSLIALAFSQAQYRDTARTAEFARGILMGVPLSLTFFVPFVFADRLKWPFWALYGTGLILLGLSYLIHQRLFQS